MKIVEVNLLPSEYRPPKPLGPRQFLLVGVMFVVIIALMTYYRGVMGEREKVLAQNRLREAELASIRSQLEESERLRERENKVAAAEVDLRGMEGRRWSPLLLRMADRTAPGLAWVHLSSDGSRIEVRGVASGLEPLARFATGLSAEPFVDRIQIHDYAEDAEKKLHSYRMTILLEGEDGHAAKPE